VRAGRRRGGSDVGRRCRRYSCAAGCPLCPLLCLLIVRIHRAASPQFHQNIQRFIDTHAAIQACTVGCISSELYAAPCIIDDGSLQQPLYVEFTWSNLPQGRGAHASFVAAHARCARCSLASCSLSVFHSIVARAILTRDILPSISCTSTPLLSSERVLSSTLGTCSCARRGSRGRGCGCRRLASRGSRPSRCAQAAPLSRYAWCMRRYRAERAQVWLHSDANTLPPCGNEKFKEDMDGALDDLSSARLEGGNSIICKNCSHWLQ
jgi:hypothetical protein